MTGNAINAKSEALELHELSSEELDAVSGGTTISEQAKIDALENAQKAQEDKKQADALKGFQQLLQEI
jgi:hypothetical protein